MPIRVRARVGVFALVALVAFTGVAYNLVKPVQTDAATNNVINFQARLESSAGAIVPDGNYNVEFKLYEGGTSSGGGTLKWTEDYLNSSSQGITVANGYLTANLGSITSLATAGINWDQQLYLTMNIGGTGGSASWDGQMTPRLLVTAVPYAFRAGTLADPANSGSTLTWATQGTAHSLLLPNEAGTLCVENSANCGFLTGSASSYIQNGTSVQASSNFNISGNGTIGGTLQAATVNATSAIQLGGANINTGGTLTNVAYLNYANQFTNTSSFKVTSPTAFQIQNSGGTSNLFIANTTNSVIGIGEAPTSGNGILQLAGALTLDGGYAGTVNFTTPVGSHVATAINIPLYDPGAFGQVLAFGLPSGADYRSRAISVFDDRSTTDNQPAIGVFNSNETNILGLSWDGGVTTGYLKTLSGGAIGFRSGGTTLLGLDSVGNATLTGDIQVQGGDVTTNQTSFNLLNTTATTLNIGGAVGAGGINLAGGSGSTGCTLDGSTGALTCSGTLTVGTNTSLSATTLTIGGNAVCTSTGCTAAGGGVTTVGGIDTQTPSANGAVISGSSIYLQSASATNPGLINTTSGQTFAGDKTFNGSLTVGGNYNTNTFTSSSLQFGASGAASIDSAAGQNLQIAAAASNKTIQIGNNTSTGATQTINVGYNSSAGALNTHVINVNIGTASNSNATTTIQAGYSNGSIQIGSLNSGATQTINVGTNTASTQTVTVGSKSATSSTTTIQGGSGSSAILVQAANSGTITIGNQGASSANTINIGAVNSVANADTINIGTSSGAAQTVTVGSTSTTSTTNIQGGTGGTINIGAVGASTNASTVHIADQSNGSGNQTVSIGSTNGSSTVVIQGGSPGAGAGVSIVSGSAPIQIGTNSTAHTVTIGNTTGASAVALQGGTGGISLQSTGNITVGTSDTTGTLLVVDTKTSSGDPTGVNGGMYYNSNSSKFRCYQGGTWLDCVGAGAGVNSLQAAYTGGNTIAIPSAGASVQISAPSGQEGIQLSTTGGGNAPFLDWNNGTSAFGIRSDSNGLNFGTWDSALQNTFSNVFSVGSSQILVDSSATLKVQNIDASGAGSTITRTNRTAAASSTNYGTGSYTPSGTFTPGANHVLMAYVNFEPNNQSMAGDGSDITISGGSLTWVPVTGKFQKTGGNWGDGFRVFYAVTSGTPPSNMQVTVDAGTFNINKYEVTVDDMSGVDTSSPVAGQVTGGRQSNSSNTWTATLTSTPATADWKILTGSIDQDNATHAWNAASGWTEYSSPASLKPSPDATVMYQTGSSTTTLNYSLGTVQYANADTAYGGFILKAASGSTLNIGSASASSINIGNSTSQTNVNGSFQVLNSTNVPLLSVNTSSSYVDIQGTGTNGSNGRLAFGDYNSSTDNAAWIGEYGTTDTDMLQLNGEKGIVLTSGSYTSPLEIAQFYVDSNFDHMLLGENTSSTGSGIDLFYGSSSSPNWEIGTDSDQTCSLGGGAKNLYFYTTDGGCALQFGYSGGATFFASDQSSAFQVLNDAEDSEFNINTSSDTISLFSGITGGSLITDLGSASGNHGVCHSGAAATLENVRLIDCSATAGADYAENYPVSSGVGYGDIVSMGTNMVNTYGTDSDGNIDWTKVLGQITQLNKSSSPYQANTIGIVSDNHSDFSSAGYNIKSADNPMPVALNGRVPVNVSPTSGAIQPGDYLTTSGDSGKAMKATQAGFVIGKALEAWDPASGKTQVMVYVEQGFWPGPSQASYLQNGADASLGNLTVNGLSTVNDVQANGTITAGSLVSGTSTTDSLSVGGNANVGNLLANGTITTNNLTVNGSTTVASLTATSISATSASIGDLTVSGAITTGDLNVTGLATIGSASIGTLHVTGAANVSGDLTIGGHLITAGHVPTAQIESAAGVDASCTISGNDTGGSITVKAGTASMADGAQCTLTFNNAYGQAPNPVISPRNKDSAQVQAFVDSAASKLVVEFAQPPVAGKTYVFNYFNAQ